MDAERPQRRRALGAGAAPHPDKKAYVPPQTRANYTGAGSDDDLADILASAGPSRTVVVDYGASWCDHCKGMIPAFVRLSSQFVDTLFVVADVDRVPRTSADIRFTPTFAFYRNGRKVDEIYGSNVQRLRDHIWLHSPAT
eukprot:jgi/Chlat1/3371/Chrsp23S03716